MLNTAGCSTTPGWPLNSPQPVLKYYLHHLVQTRAVVGQVVQAAAGRAHEDVCKAVLQALGLSVNVGASNDKLQMQQTQEQAATMLNCENQFQILLSDFHHRQMYGYIMDIALMRLQLHQQSSCCHPVASVLSHLDLELVEAQQLLSLSVDLHGQLTRRAQHQGAHLPCARRLMQQLRAARCRGRTKLG